MPSKPRKPAPRKKPAYDAIAVAQKLERAAMERLEQIMNESEDESAQAVAAGQIVLIARAQRVH